VTDPLSRSRPICDYEGSRYRTEFWGAGREYEDAVERTALAALLPPAGGRLIEIGAGYGRLAPLYAGYDQVVLFDYALSQLRQAQELLGDAGRGGDPHYIYVAGDFYALPFVAGAFDAVTMIRTLHHATDAAAVLRGVGEVLAPGGALVLEFANKHNLKAILRYVLGRQTWSPFEREPVEFVALNFDFHPAWIRERLAESGLRVKRQRTVSHFRVGVLKRMLPTRLLAAVDRAMQPSGGLFQLSPSVFVRCEAPADRPAAMQGVLFRCVACGCGGLEVDGKAVLACTDCGARYGIDDGIYDFRSPIGGATA
jgi:ubiquinone/menaquinone biosynthesis C-methylase UbiE